MFVAKGHEAEPAVAQGKDFVLDEMIGDGCCLTRSDEARGERQADADMPQQEVAESGNVSTSKSRSRRAQVK
jgi:hypothetical protein